MMMLMMMFKDTDLCLSENRLVSGHHCVIEKDSTGNIWLEDIRFQFSSLSVLKVQIFSKGDLLLEKEFAITVQYLFVQFGVFICTYNSFVQFYTVFVIQFIHGHIEACSQVYIDRYFLLLHVYYFTNNTMLSPGLGCHGY